MPLSAEFRDHPLSEEKMVQAVMSLNQTENKEKIIMFDLFFIKEGGVGGVGVCWKCGALQSIAPNLNTLNLNLAP